MPDAPVPVSRPPVPAGVPPAAKPTDRHAHFQRGRPRPPEVIREGEEMRLRLPRRHEGEMFAMVLEQKGGSRMVVQCEDGKERLARIPGRIRRRLWVKDGDILVIKPWSVEGDSKADLEYRYTNVQVEALRRRGILKL